MEKCKYCGEQFENKGKLLSHYKSCPAKDNPKCCKVITEAPVTVEINPGEAYVLVKPEDYIPSECVNDALAEKDQRICALERALADAGKVDAVSSGELYWPLSRLPREFSLLAEGQYVILKCSGRIKGDKVIIEEVKV